MPGIAKIACAVCVCVILYKALPDTNNTTIDDDDECNSLDSGCAYDVVASDTPAVPMPSLTQRRPSPKVDVINGNFIIENEDTTTALPAIDSPHLIAYIQKSVLESRDQSHVPLNLDKPWQVYYSQIGQDKIVDKILQGKKDGFFIEAGAQSGELLSNTLYFEKSLNWTGLLVEPSLFYYRLLRKKSRNTYTANTCLSTRPYPIRIDFNGNQIFEPGISLIRDKVVTELQCIPLFSLLLAMDPPVYHIDYFSLDVDGPELQILQTIPWDRLNITVLSVEVQHSPFPLDLNTKNKIISLVTAKGYHYVKHYFDIIFIKNGTVYDRDVVMSMLDKKNI